MKQQNIAQSLVSLGQLARQCGDECTDDPTAHYTKARGHLEGACIAYTRGFHEMHPKVANPHEGLGQLYEKEGNLEAAIAEYEKAATIRRAVKSQDTTKQMFQKELDQVEALLAAAKAKLPGAGAPAPAASTVDVELVVSR